MTYNGVELYVKGNKVGVLVSRGFGAGWSTWERKELAYDKRVIEYWLAHKDDKQFMNDVDEFRDNKTKAEVTAFFRSIGYGEPYLGGFADIDLEWVPFGVPWRINEYDGAESLWTVDDEEFITFVKDGTK